MGYGVGGRCFHAPFIEAAEGIELRQLQALLAGGVDAVTITTPPETWRGPAPRDDAVSRSTHARPPLRSVRRPADLVE